MLEQRFALEYRQTPTDQPGLVMRDDGVLQRIKPDGTRELVPGGGGGGDILVQPTDPGAIGAGKVWVDTSGDDGVAMVFKVRSSDDAQWASVFAFDTPAGGTVPTYILYGDGNDIAPGYVSGNSLGVSMLGPSDGVSVTDNVSGSQKFRIPAGDDLTFIGWSTNRLAIVVDDLNQRISFFARGSAQELFRIDGVTGALHGRAGQAIVFDL